MSMLPADAHRVLFKEPVTHEAVWFMFDCHLFSRVDMRDRERAYEQISDLFTKDGCGMLSTKSQSGVRLALSGEPKAKPLHGHVLPGGDRSGVTASEINVWLDNYYAASQP